MPVAVYILWSFALTLTVSPVVLPVCVDSAWSLAFPSYLVPCSPGTSKVPLNGFKALQGISGPQRFQIHKSYGKGDRLPSAHTCFNQLDLPEYESKEQLAERLMMAIHEGHEGFGFG